MLTEKSRVQALETEKGAQASRKDAGNPGITLFLPSLLGGGAERVMVNLANELYRRGEEPGFLLFTRRGVYFDELNEEVQVSSLDMKGIRELPKGLSRYLSYLRRNRDSVILVSGHLAFLLAFLGRLFSKNKVVVVVHNTVSKEGKLSKFIPKTIYRFADQIIAVSHGVAADLSEYGNIELDRISVIHNAVDLVRVERAKSDTTPHEWFEDTAVPVVLGVGRLNAQKRFDVLLRAVAHINSKRPIRLIVLGEGPLRQELEGLAHELGIADSVRFIGFVDNPYAYMHAASVFVLSSDFEGFGVVLVEALACGCPIVSTDCPSGPSEILEDGKWGALTPVGDPSAIAVAVEDALDHPPLCGRQRSRAEAFSVEHSAKEYLKVLLEAIAEVD